MKSKLLLLLILLSAFIFRFVSLDSMPISPNWDEVSHGYNAYSLLKTGKDEWGIRTPLIFQAFGDFKLPLYIYLTILPVSIFGLNVFAIRFVSALAGVLAVWGIYLLAKKIFSQKGNQSIPLLSAFLLAFLPWHFFISRPALEANLALTLITFGIYFLLSGLEKPRYYLPSALLLGLSLHTYNTARVFVPLTLLSFLFFFRRRLKLTPSSVIASIIILFFGSIVAAQMISGSGTARYKKLNIITTSTAYTLGQKRLESGLPAPLARLIYNRPVYFVETFFSNYINYFSPTFFNQSYGAQSQFAIPNKSLLGFPFVLALLFGLISFIKTQKNEYLWFLFSVLLFSPVAASLTVDPPQALRPNPMIIPLVLIAANGLFAFLSLLPARFVTKSLLLFIILTIFSFSLYQNEYYRFYKNSFAQSWQYGYKEVFDYLKTQSGYDRVFITKRYGEPHIFYAFYHKLEPQVLQDQIASKRFFQSDWYWTDRINNIYFFNEFDLSENSTQSITLESKEVVPTPKSILVTTPGHVPTNADIQKEIKFPNGEIAFIIAKMP